ncbi:YciI family protein [uncultured Oscillibacter sp.]|uniref:YciI family protein n=1 Tax=uncultured Oscillibacter sp. TaxID=876091 RepID=UPI002632B9FB|nr:YciI family protein [uncultured Oscillibacter sp.]
MFLFNLTYKKPLEEIERLLPAHIAFLDEFYDKGKFLCSGRKEPRTGGVILCNCDSLEEAEEIRHRDPFFYEGAADYEIIRFQPTKMSPGFQAMLEETQRQ